MHGGATEVQKQVVKPEFTKPLHSADVPEGSALTLECHMTGTPEPTVSWFLGDENIDKSPYYLLNNVGGELSLKVSDSCSLLINILSHAWLLHG